MSLDDFDSLFADADRRRSAIPLAVVGADDPTVLPALREATDRGWVRPILFGPVESTRTLALELGIALDGLEQIETGTDAESTATRAVECVESGMARLLMKGRIATPSLMRAILRPSGLRTARTIGQVVLMEIPRDHRRFLLTDTGITIRPTIDQKADLLLSSLAIARALGAEQPRVALMAASESVNPSMPETLDAAALQQRASTGEFGACEVQGPLSFDLAYASDAGHAKHVEGQVVGAAEIFLFPDLLSANLTVKAIMYTADCRFGGVLVGTRAPVVFMSRADSITTRLHSLALALRVLASQADRRL